MAVFMVSAPDFACHIRSVTSQGGCVKNSRTARVVGRWIMSVATAGDYQSGRRGVVGSPSGGPTLIQPLNGNRAGLWPLNQVGRECSCISGRSIGVAGTTPPSGGPTLIWKPRRWLAVESCLRQRPWPTGAVGVFRGLRRPTHSISFAALSLLLVETRAGTGR